MQERVQKELDSIVGTETLPSLQDRPKLPYVEVVLTKIINGPQICYKLSIGLIFRL